MVSVFDSVFYTILNMIMVLVMVRVFILVVMMVTTVEVTAMCAFLTSTKEERGHGITVHIIGILRHAVLNRLRLFTMTEVTTLVQIILWRVFIVF